MKVGRAIDVGQVISRSTRILIAQPVILVPQLIILVPTLLGDALSASSILSPLRVLTSILSFVFSLIASGAYPSLVKAVIDGGQISLTEALGKAYRRFWTLLAASILVGIIVVLGLIALIVPGIILATWYAYTVPAIMLEDKGALEGMSASKAFGRDKKGRTFLIFVTVAIVGLIVLSIQSIVSIASPFVGELVYDILLVPLGAWISVILAYTYLTYGPSLVPAKTEPSGFGMAPLAPPQPTASVGMSGGFCQYCGAPIPAGSRFCASCGKSV